jgi:hypothetical protein
MNRQREDQAMTLSVPRPSSKVTLLPRDVSLTRGCPPAPPGTLFVQGTNGGMSVAPDAGFDVLFGRNDPEVHVCVGPDDVHVSRKQGYITRDCSRWILNNVGGLPIRFPGAQLVLKGQWAELPTAYSPLFIVGPHREHLLEVRISAGSSLPPNAESTYEHTTEGGVKWTLRDDEKIVLVCLAQRYLRQEPQPQPMAWDAIASELTELQPDKGWNWRKAARLVDRVRKRLSDPKLGAKRVRGLLAEDVPPPIGNALNHNLIMELLVTTTITPEDLLLIGG